MDQFKRRIVGFAFIEGLSMGWHCVACSGNRLGEIRCQISHSGSDEIKTVAGASFSYPFIERLIGTIRSECLDQTLFWTTADLEAKRQDFQEYFNVYRTHTLGGQLPEPNEETKRNKVRVVPMAKAFSQVISDTDCGMTLEFATS
jgi:hypothetical protein